MGLKIGVAAASAVASRGCAHGKRTGARSKERGEDRRRDGSELRCPPWTVAGRWARGADGEGVSAGHAGGAAAGRFAGGDGDRSPQEENG